MLLMLQDLFGIALFMSCFDSNELIMIRREDSISVFPGCFVCFIHPVISTTGFGFFVTCKVI